MPLYQIKRFSKSTLLSVLFFMGTSLALPKTAAAEAPSTVQGKGQQCVAWVKEKKLRRHDVVTCYQDCVVYGQETTKNPALLNDEGVAKCDASHANLKEKVAKANAAASLLADEPKTRTEFIADLKNLAGECQTMADAATNPIKKRLGNRCAGNCLGIARKMHEQRIGDNMLRANWNHCVREKEQAMTSNGTNR